MAHQAITCGRATAKHLLQEGLLQGAAELGWRVLIVPVLCRLASQPAGRSSRRLTSLQCRAALQSSQYRCLTAAAGTPALQQQTSLRAVTGGFGNSTLSSSPRMQRTFMLRILYSLLNLHTPHNTFRQHALFVSPSQHQSHRTHGQPPRHPSN